MSTMWASSNVYHKGLIWLTSKVNRMAICSTMTSPPSASAVLNTYKIAQTSGAAVGAIAATSNGFLVKVTSAASLACSSSGVARVVALCAGTSFVAYVTKCTTRALTTSDTVSIPAWRIRIAEPTSS